jgi:flagellar basal-body rod modification protein FlgD
MQFMEVSAIGIGSTGASPVTRDTTVSQENFLRILLTQLRFQDPMKPVDNQEFVAQLAQFSSLEINRQSGEKLDTLLTVTATSQALSLVGKTVEVSGAAGSGVGVVTAVGFSNGESKLTVRTSTTTLVDVRPADIILVRQGVTP